MFFFLKSAIFWFRSLKIAVLFYFSKKSKKTAVSKKVVKKMEKRSTKISLHATRIPLFSQNAFFSRKNAKHGYTLLKKVLTKVAEKTKKGQKMYEGFTPFLIVFPSKCFFLPRKRKTKPRHWRYDLKGPKKWGDNTP